MILGSSPRTKIHWLGPVSDRARLWLGQRPAGQMALRGHAGHSWGGYFRSRYSLSVLILQSPGGDDLLSGLVSLIVTVEDTGNLAFDSNFHIRKR